MTDEEWKKQAAAERARMKARAARFMKPMMSILNLRTIKQELDNISEQCSNAAWMEENDRDKLIALMDDEDDAYEFQMEFSQLDTDCQRMHDDLMDIQSENLYGLYNGNRAGDYDEDVDSDNTWFDDVFCLIGAGAPQFGDMMGFDMYEEDYYGLDTYDCTEAKNAYVKRLMKFTKVDLLEHVAQAVKIAMQFAAIQERYAQLQAALEFLEAESGGHVKAVQEMNEAYEAAEKDGMHNYEAWTRFDRLCDNLPPECWLY